MLALASKDGPTAAGPQRQISSGPSTLLGLDFPLTRSFVLVRVLESVLYGACAGEGSPICGGLLVGSVPQLGAQVGFDAAVVRGARHECVQPAATADLQ